MSKLTKWLDPKQWLEDRQHYIPIDRSYRSNFITPFYDFQQEIDNLFKNFYRSLPATDIKFDNLNLNPSVDIIEDDKNLKVELEMPGVDEKDINVSIDNGMLIIRASKQTSKKDEGKNYVLREIGYGAYERRIPLPDNADSDNAESTFKKGMLWVNIPKKATDTSKVRELEVKKAAAQ